jgi:hypothetical protein
VPTASLAAANSAQGKEAAGPALPLPPPDFAAGSGAGAALAAPPLPAEWPDPRGLVPPPPSPLRPVLLPQHAPLMTHTRVFNGHDAQFTERLASYFFLRDDARFGGWPAYLERPEDFVRFCCHLHLTETLAARGGAGEARVLWRWPLRRYER